MAAVPKPSASLVRAVQGEDSRLLRALEVLEQRRAGLQAELAAVDGERRELLARRRLLAEVAGVEVASKDDGQRVVAHTQLKGRELRRVAGRLLWERQRDREIHYREWFEHVLGAGYAVAGKDPAASFLTNVRDSPVVTRGSVPGHYRIDTSAGDRIRQERAEVAAEMDDLQGRIAMLERNSSPGVTRSELDRLRTHRRDLKAKLRRLAAEADELTSVLGPTEEDRQLLVA